MKSTLITAAALGLALSAGAYANPADHGGMHDRHMDRLTERLDLTGAQRDEVKALMDAHRARTADAREAIEQSRERLHADLRALLTPEQAAKLDEMHANKGKHMDKDKDKDRQRDGHADH